MNNMAKFKCVRFEGRVREALNITHDKPLLLSEVENVEYLIGCFESIEGIDQLKNLKDFRLGQCELLKSETNLLLKLDKLETLNLDMIHVTNLDFLLQLKNLKSLTLAGAEIVEISSLRNLENLERLNISFNDIRDLSPLFRLHNISSLSINNNYVTDISVVANMRSLKYLNINDNDVKSIKVLDSIKSLETVEMVNNNNIIDYGNTELKGVFCTHDYSEPYYTD